METAFLDEIRRQEAGHEVKRWRAENENASARLELARMKEAIALLLAQHEPVASLGIRRDALRVLLDYVRHHDTHRLAREVEQFTGGSK